MQTSHIGSLPFTDFDKAIEFNHSFDIPVLFSLPTLDEKQFMLAQAEDLLFNRGLISNQEAIRDSDLFKFQLPCPFTIKKFLQKIPSIDEYLFALSKLKVKKQCIFFFDAPVFNKIKCEDFVRYDEYIERIKTEFGFKVGVHICCNVTEESIKSLSKLDYINIDLSLNPKLESVVNSYGVSVDTKITTDCKLITPPCGLALKSEAECNHLKTYLDQCRDKGLHL